MDGLAAEVKTLKLLSRAALPIFILAIAMFVGRSTTNTSEHEHLQNSATNQELSENTNSDNDTLSVGEAFDVLKGAAGGMRPQAEIEDEFELIAGSSRPVPIGEIVLKNNYRLTLIATHHVNLDTKLQILSLHSLPHEGFREDVVTYYSQKVDQGDEQQIQSSIVIPKTIRVVDGHAQVTNSDLESYYFRLENEQNSSAGQFGLREPLASPIRSNSIDQSFNPLSPFIANHLSLGKMEDGQYELAANGMTYSVTVTPRLNELGQLTLEVSVREINSLVVTSYALVYENENI